MGLPAEKAQYIHRVGRTARAGKRGRGVLLLSDFEAPFFLNQLRDVKISSAPPLPSSAIPALQVEPSSAASAELLLTWSSLLLSCLGVGGKGIGEMKAMYAIGATFSLLRCGSDRVLICGCRF